MRGAIRWVPILRNSDDARSREEANSGSIGDEPILVRLPRHSTESHPLAILRPKPRERRSPSLLLRRRLGSSGNTAGIGAPTPPAESLRDDASLAGGDNSQQEIDSANRGGVLDPFAFLSAVGSASSPHQSSAANQLSSLSGSPLEPAVGGHRKSLGSGGGGGAGGARRRGSSHSSSLSLIGDDERTRVVAAVGFSDDPLSLMMEQRAVARNISRHGGDVEDDDTGMTLASSGGPRGSLGSSGGALRNEDDLERRASGSSSLLLDSARRARGQSGTDGDKGGGDGEGASSWGRRWGAHRQEILREFGKVGDDGSGADQAAGPPATRKPAVNSRYESRIAELDGTASATSGGSGGGGGSANVAGSGSGRGIAKRGKGVAGGLLLTPAEYTAHVGNLRSELEDAWAREEKVTALKVTVQAAKLLGDTSVPTFYPGLFALIAGLLEAFGVMVFDRIRARAEDAGEGAGRPSPPPQATAGGDNQAAPAATPSASASRPLTVRHPLPEGWTCNEVGAEARETCRNWFYKTACIRELLPRILVEAALLPCYRFLAMEDEFGQLLGRLSTLVRGVGDPMVAVYCRCFVAAAGNKIAPSETAHAASSLQDYLFSLQEVQQGKLAGYFRGCGLGMSEYVRLHGPGVDWLLSIIGPGAPRSVFTKILTSYRNYCGSLEVLRLVLKHFSPEHYAPFALEMAILIKQGHGTSAGCSTAELMALLGNRLAATPPTGADAVPLLNEAWQEIAPAPLKVYIEGASAWLGLLLASSAYGPDEVAILVEDVACRIEGATSSELSRVQTALADGVVRTLSASEDALVLEAAGAHVVKILGVLDKSRRAQACLDLLAGFLRVVPNTHESSSLSSSSSSRRHQAQRPKASESRLTSAREDSDLSPTHTVERKDVGREDPTNVFASSAAGAGGDVGGGGGGGVGLAGAEGGLELARALVGVAKLLHDSLDILVGGESQRQHAASLTCDLVDRVGRGGWRLKGGAGAAESEGSCLSLLVECREAFWSMDEVTDRLVLAAAGLSVRAWRAGCDATTRAALCFCSITVPSVPSALRRLALLQLCANAALKVGKPALADALFRSAICVVPECTTLVHSGWDPTVASLSRGRLSDKSSVDDRGGGGSGSGGGGIDFWGSVAGGTGAGSAGRRQQTGAWLLAGAVRGLLGALVAAPGHPDLGPFYLLRGLLKAIRRLPWPAGSGLLASLYISAAGLLCAMWQERLPYSIGGALTAAGTKSNDGGDDHDSWVKTTNPSDDTHDLKEDRGGLESDATAARIGVGGAGRNTESGGDVSREGAVDAPGKSNTNDVGGGQNVVGLFNDDTEGGTGISESNGTHGGQHGELDEGTARVAEATTYQGGVDAAESDGGGSGGAAVSSQSNIAATADDGRRHSGDFDRDGEKEVSRGAVVDNEEDAAAGLKRAEEDDALDATAGRAAGVPEAAQESESGAGPEELSWLKVGGMLGSDDLYLRNAAYLREVQGLLSDILKAALKELEELREQGEAADMLSASGSDQARTARLRYATLSLDLANQLVSTLCMEGGAANVVTYIIEASARAGARDIPSSIGVSAVGGRSSSRDRRGGYFQETVDFIAVKAKSGLERTREAQRQSVNLALGGGGGKGSQELIDKEEACLTLLQGLSGFTR